MGIPCQWLSPECGNIGAEFEFGLATLPNPFPAPCGSVLFATASKTDWILGDDPSGTVNGPTGGAIKRGSEAKMVPHVCIMVATPPPVFAMPVVDFGYSILRTITSSSKTNFASFSVSADNGQVSVIGAPYVFTTVGNQRHCNNVFPMPSMLNVQPPSSVLVGMSPGDYTGSLFICGMEGLKSGVTSALLSSGGDALGSYGDNVAMAKLCLESMVDDAMPQSAADSVKSTLALLLNPADAAFDTGAKALGFKDYGSMGQELGELNAETVDAFFEGDDA